MVFDVANETDLFMLTAMVKSFRNEGVEFTLERDCTFEMGCERTYVKLVV